MGTLNFDDDLDPVRSHSQEPAEGDAEPGEAPGWSSHSEEPSEGPDEED